MRKYLQLIFRFGFYLVGAYPKILWYRIFMHRISYEKRYDFIRRLAQKFVKRMNVKCSIQGEEAIPEGNNLIFLPNHQSLFDTVLLVAKLNHRVAFIAKKEVKKMPIISTMATMAETILLNREDARAALLTLREAAKQLANGRNLLVFLEGTRSKSQTHDIGTYKNGGIRPGYVTKATLVPIVMDPVWEVFDKSVHKKEYIIKITYLKPMKYEDYCDTSYADLANLLHDSAVKTINDMRKDNSLLTN